MSKRVALWFLLCYVHINHLFAEENAIDLIVKAFQNSGCNPAIFKTGTAEFEMVEGMQNGPSPQRATTKNREERKSELKQVFQSDPKRLGEEIQKLENAPIASGAMTVSNSQKLRILMDGTDNTFGKEDGKKYKRLVDSQLMITDAVDATKGRMDFRRTISMGVLNQSDSIIQVESYPAAKTVSLTNSTVNHHEFQTFGRIWEVGGSEIANIARAKVNRTDFSFPSNFSSFFTGELNRLGLTCEITGEKKYDGDAKATIIQVKKGNDLVEEYHIDAERGYICPYMKVNVSNVFSTECTARGYALADNAGIYYPKEYVFSFEHVPTGKMDRVYKLIDKTLKFNKKISEREFAIDVSEGEKVRDMRSEKTIGAQGLLTPAPKTLITYHAVKKGVLSLSTDYSDLAKLSWLVREEDMKDYVPPRGGAGGYVRVVLIAAGIMMIVFALAKKYRDKNKPT